MVDTIPLTSVGRELLPQQGEIMQSLNFEFLRPHVQLAADLAGFAEKYTYSDPQGAAVKLRSFTEELVEQIYTRQRLSRPYDAHLSELLDAREFTVGTIVEKRSVSIARKQIVLGRVTEMERDSAEADCRRPRCGWLVWVKPMPLRQVRKSRH